MAMAVAVAAARSLPMLVVMARNRPPRFAADNPQVRIRDAEPIVVRDPLAASRRIWQPLSTR